MSRPANLKTGDILLYLNNGWLGNAIGWGEWRGTKGEATEYSHVGLVYGPVTGQGCEMNPPKSRILDLDKEPWDKIVVYRIEVGGLCPFDNLKVADAFRKDVDANVGKPYNFGYIAGLLGLGILARIGLGGVSRWALSKNNPLPTAHHEICSTWATDRLETAIRAIKPDFDLFPDLGVDQASPSDFPRSPFVKRIS